MSGPAKEEKGREEGGVYRRQRTLMTASEEPRMTACDMRRMVWLNNRPAPEEIGQGLSVYRFNTMDNKAEGVPM